MTEREQFGQASFPRRQDYFDRVRPVRRSLPIAVRTPGASCPQRLACGILLCTRLKVLGNLRWRTIGRFLGCIHVIPLFLSCVSKYLNSKLYLTYVKCIMRLTNSDFPASDFPTQVHYSIVLLRQWILAFSPIRRRRNS
jgi:hypothetical protein